MARRTVSLDELDDLEVDEKTNRLYWRGKEIVMRQQIALSPWVNAAVILGSLSTAGMFGVMLWQAF